MPPSMLLLVLAAATTAAAPPASRILLIAQEPDWAAEFERAYDAEDVPAALAAALAARKRMDAGAPAAERAFAAAAFAWAAAHDGGEALAREAADAARAAEALIADEREAPRAAALLFEAWHALGELDPAEAWAERLSRLPPERTGWLPSYPFARLGRARWSAADAVGADRCFRRACELLGDDADPGFRAWVRLEHANARLELGAYPDALALFALVESDPALAAEPSLLAQAAMRRSAALADLGRHAEAEERLTTAAGLAEAAGLDRLLPRLHALGADNALRARDLDAAERWVATMPQAEEDDDPWILKTVRTARSRLALRAGDAAAAARWAEEAAAAVGPDDPREWLLLPRLAQARAALARGDREEPARALGQAAAVLDSPQTRRPGAARVHLRSRYADWLALAADLAVANAEAVGAGARAAAVAAGWNDVDRWKARTLAESIGAGSPAELALGPGEVMIDYVAGDSEVLAFLRTAAGEELRALGDRDEIETAMAEYAEQLADPYGGADLQELAGTGARLYDLLLRPLLPEDAKRVFLVPEPAWPAVPFAALISSVPAHAAVPADLRYAADDLCFVYAPSRAIGLRLRAGDGGDAVGPPLIFADPVGADGRWPPLPGTRDEAAAVAAALPGARVLSGEAATRAALLEALPRSPIVHLATHAVADPIAPGESRIACSGTGPDADLRLAELEGLRLRAGIVVLSACETAGGRALRGEGVQSLAAGFLRAGARSVVATSWPVFDQDAAAQMREFHARLAAGGARPEEALRYAQLALLRGEPELALGGAPQRGAPEGGRPLAAAGAAAAPRAAHPMRWAAFVYYGPFAAR